MSGKQTYSESFRQTVVEYCRTHEIRDAVRHFGINYQTIYGWVRKGGGPFKRNGNGPKGKSGDMDLTLAVLEAVTPEHHEWSERDLADVCKVSQQAINQMIRKTLRKVRNRIRVRCPEIYQLENQ